MTLALIARGDQGGLAALTHAFWKHLRPEITVLLDLGPTPEHSPTNVGLYSSRPGLVVVDEWRTLGERASGLFGTAATILTAESWYDPWVADWAATNGIKTVLYAMPELYEPALGRAQQIWVPTPWALDRMPPGTVHVPMPVDLDLHPYRQRTRATTFFHPGAPAMEDRNGIDTVWAAITRVRSRNIRIVARRPHNTRYWSNPPRPRQIPKGVTVEVLDPCSDVEDAIPDDTDVMLLPRRYGGLSLSANEAAARGIPIVMTDLPPQNAWLPEACRIPVLLHRTRTHHMKGGDYPIYTGDSAALARTIDRFVNSPALVAECSAAVRAYAETISWEQWAPIYREMLA